MRLSLLLILFYSLRAFSDNALDLCEEPINRFYHIGKTDGLLSDIVRKTLISNDGTIYFATMNGVSAYQPQASQFRSYRFSDPKKKRVMDIIESKYGIMIATQGSGVALLKDGTWQFFSNESGMNGHAEITALYLDHHDQIWATPTGGGIYRFDGKRWTLLGKNLKGEFGRCKELKHHQLICTSYQPKTLFIFKNNQFIPFRLSPPLSSSFYVHDLIQSKNGEIWLATKGAGVLVGSPTQSKSENIDDYHWKTIKTEKYAPSIRAGSIFQAKNRNIWVATSTGVSVFDGIHWQHFGREQGLKSSQVFSISEEKDGTIWLSTLGGGVSRLAFSGWSLSSSRCNFNSQTITRMKVIGDTLLIGTLDGLFLRAKNQTRRFDTEKNTQIVDLFYHRKKGLYIGTVNGLYYSNAIDSPVLSKISPHRIKKIRYSPLENDLFYLTSSNQVIATKKNKLIFEPKNEKIDDFIVDSKGNFWFATKRGVLEWRREAKTQKTVRHLIDDEPSRTQRIYNLVLDEKGRIWASGLSSAHIYDGKRWRVFKDTTALPEGIYSRFLTHTADGSFYFSIRGLGSRRFYHGRWRFYDSSMGLASDRVFDVTSLADGRILFATSQGLSIYRPDRKPPHSFWSLQRHKAIEGDTINLHYFGRDPYFHTSSDNLQFSIRINNQTWSPYSHKKNLVLKNLAAGHYTIDVKTMDSDFNEDQSPARFELDVILPWWKNPLFIALTLAVIALLLFSLWKYTRALELKRKALGEAEALIEERRRFVRLASHELRKPLTRLSHRAEMLNMPEFQTTKDTISKNAQAIIDESNHLSKLVEALLNQARVEGGLNLNIERVNLTRLIQTIAEEFSIHALSLPDDEIIVNADPLYLHLLISNLFDNAQKYGNDTDKIKCSLEKRKTHIYLIISDQGPGIALDERDRIFEPFNRGKTDPKHGGFGLGLALAKDIAIAHRGNLELLPSDIGASFRITLPAK